MTLPKGGIFFLVRKNYFPSQKKSFFQSERKRRCLEGQKADAWRTRKKRQNQREKPKGNQRQNRRETKGGTEGKPEAKPKENQPENELSPGQRLSFI